MVFDKQMFKITISEKKSMKAVYENQNIMRFLIAASVEMTS